jgi:transposase
MHIASIGIDLGKTTFHLGCIGGAEQDSGSQEILPYADLGPSANLLLSSIGLEACAEAHFLTRGCASRDTRYDTCLRSL